MFTSFEPKNTLLLGPGPSPVSESVLASLSKPTIGHLDSSFFVMMDEIKVMLRLLFSTTNDITFPVSGPGSAGMDTCVVNLVEPGDEVIVCINGAFGQRIAESVAKVGGIVTEVHSEWGSPTQPEQLEQALLKTPNCKIVSFVHAETSTGVRNDAKTLCEIAHRYGALTLVDAVTSLGGIPVCVDEWGIDAVFSGSQKCLSCPPGLSPVSFSQRAVNKANSRTSPIPSWFMDVTKIASYWTGQARAYHHTAPVNALYGLHQSLVDYHSEGKEPAFTRHAAASTELIKGLAILGLYPLVVKKYRLPQLVTVKVPEYLDEEKLRKVLLDTYDIEIGAGLGKLAGKVFRIGVMGNGARIENMQRLLSALSEVLVQDFVSIKCKTEEFG
ncbi:alanine--glyoxylate aminotransferase family protein [Vibrio metschnikovii]|uniref:pyridoxal-phosphate-dependent aminotransferase family protein n=1 Tax=Vibrio metschnikovii TaxID=28172 RepID=UPI00315D7730